MLTNQVVANYPDGMQHTIFKSTEPSMTAKEMEELLVRLDDLWQGRKSTKDRW